MFGVPLAKGAGRVAPASRCASPLARPALPCPGKSLHLINPPCSRPSPHPAHLLRAVMEEVRLPKPAEQQQHDVAGGPAKGRLKDEGTAYEEEHKIRAYECGPDQRTTITTIANLLQEISGNHGVALWGRTEAGFATDPIMVERNLIFVSTRIQIQMDSYPRWGDEVQFETWFQEEGRISICRNWLIRNAAGEEVGRGTSTWVMLNVLTRRISKIPDGMREKLNNLAPRPFRDAIAPALARQKLGDVPLPAEIEGPPQVARRSDMDMNGHINNVTYLGWALETVPEDVATNFTLHQVEIDFKAECMAGDTVESLGSRVDEQTNGTGIIRYTHLVRCCKDGDCRELVRARSTWRPSHLAAQALHN